MKPIVIDASMAAGWTLDDEKTEVGDKILDEVKNRYLITPSLFWYEYRSILVNNQKRGRIPKDKVSMLLKEVRALEIEEYSLDDDQAVITLAFQHNLSAYDAAYLALAIQEDAVLATNDKKLASAALAANIDLRTALNEKTLNT